MLLWQATTGHRIESKAAELYLAVEVKWPGLGPDEGMDGQQLQINNGN